MRRANKARTASMHHLPEQTVVIISLHVGLLMAYRAIVQYTIGKESKGYFLFHCLLPLTNLPLATEVVAINYLPRLLFLIASWNGKICPDK